MVEIIKKPIEKVDSVVSAKVESAVVKPKPITSQTLKSSDPIAHLREAKAKNQLKCGTCFFFTPANRCHALPKQVVSSGNYASNSSYPTNDPNIDWCKQWQPK